MEEVDSFEITDPDDFAELACLTYVRFTRASTEVQARIDADLAEVGLTFSQFAAMEVLYTKGPCCQRDIAQRILAHSSGNMTLVIDHLEQRGFVERVPARTDRRMVEVRLTPTGEALISAFLPKHIMHITDEMSVLTPEELKILSDLSRKLGRGPSGEP